MQLVDTIKCVYCGHSEHRMSTGKSARQMSGVCAKCLNRDSVQKELFNETSKDEPKGKSKVV